MKKVVVNSENTVRVSELSDHRFIGVQYSGGGRGLVIRRHSGDYVSTNPKTNLNISGCYSAESAEALIAPNISTKYGDIKEAYVFDSFEELVDWILKRNK